MKFSLLLSFLFFININALFSQNTFRDSINVVHYTIRLNLTEFTNQSISGSTELKIVSNANKLRRFNLDLLSLLVDSVYVNDTIQYDYSHNDTVLTITPKRVYFPKNDTFKVVVHYQGRPVQDSYWGGFYFTLNDAFNMGVGMASIPPCFGRAWYPCNDNFTDKATYDYYITVRNKHFAVCSGTLLSVTDNNNGTTTYHWKLKNPISTYLSSVAVSDFVEIKDMYNGMNQNIPVSIYVPQKNKLNAEKSFINLKDALKIYEECFGPYRWERVGYVQVNFDRGAMEHATNIAYPKYAIDGTLENESLMAHELAHSWFGNLVTCKKEEDMWLNEGWASYCTAIFTEKKYGKTAYKDYMRYNHMKVLMSTFMSDKGYRAVFGLPHEYTYGSTVYDKGADVVMTFRNYLGDKLFFQIIKDYINTYAFKNVATYEFCNFMQNKTGLDLFDFFNFWVYSSGFPHFSVENFTVKQNGNEYEVTVNVLQQLKSAKDFAKDNKVEIFFLDSKWNKFVSVMKVTKEKNTATFKVPFKPEIVLLDIEEKVADATTDSYKIIKSTGNYEYGNVFFVTNVNTVKDSVFLRVEHSWIASERTRKNEKDLIISNDRYWRLEGFLNKHFDANAKFYYNLSFNLDNSLATFSGNELFLLYRENKNEEWKIIKSKCVGNQTRGFLITDKLKLGEYTIGVRKK